MEFTAGPVPVRKAGDKIQTFAGGFAWAVPFGTKNPDLSWASLRALQSDEALAAWADAAAVPARAGGGVFIPGFTTVQDVDQKLRQRDGEGAAVPGRVLHARAGGVPLGAAHVP